jgi:hypothetical protein
VQQLQKPSAPVGLPADSDWDDLRVSLIYGEAERPLPATIPLPELAPAYGRRLTE